MELSFNSSIIYTNTWNELRSFFFFATLEEFTLRSDNCKGNGGDVYELKDIHLDAESHFARKPGKEDFI
jgi:hypothetical protein